MTGLIVRFTLVAVSILAPPLVSAQYHDLKFIENKNQWRADIDFLARIPGGGVSVASTGFGVFLLDGEAMEEHHMQSHFNANESDLHFSQASIDGHYFQINFLNAKKDIQPLAEGKSTEYYNYFLGNDPAEWGVDAFAYDRILYPQIYQGIDLSVSSAGSDLKYDFVVHPGASPSQIVVDYCGLYDVKLNGSDLSLKTSIGTVVEKIPYAYQLINGEKRFIRAEYKLDYSRVSFEFPDDNDPC
jgi:hypothetical protein